MAKVHYFSQVDIGKARNVVPIEETNRAIDVTSQCGLGALVSHQLQRKYKKMLKIRSKILVLGTRVKQKIFLIPIV